MSAVLIIIAYLLSALIFMSGILLCSSHAKIGYLSQFHSIVDFIITLTTYIIYKNDLPKYAFKEQYLMISYFGMYEIFITTLIFYFAFLYSTGYVDSLIESKELDESQIRYFYLVFNLLLLIEILAFCMNNLFLFWVFLEITTLLIVLLTTIPRAHYNIDAALKYTFITSSGMIFTFLGFTFLYAYVKTEFLLENLNWNQLMTLSTLLPSKLLGLIFGLTFIGFAAKSGVIPFHFWRPHLYARSPSVVSAILSTIIMNTSIYGLFRVYAIVRNSQSLVIPNTILVVFGLISIIGAAFSIIEEQNLKKIYAFSTIEHVGIIIIGLSTNSSVAMFWLLYHILAHSIAKVLLFFSAGILHRQYAKNQVTFLRDVIYLQPIASIGTIIGTIIATGFPPFAIFISKFYILSEIQDLKVLFLALLFLSISYMGMMRYISKIFSQIDLTPKQKTTVSIDLDGLSELKDYLDDDKELYSNVPIDKTTDRHFRPSEAMKWSIISLIFLGFLFGVFIPSFLASLLDKIISELGYVGR